MSRLESTLFDPEVFIKKKVEFGMRLSTKARKIILANKYL